MQITSALFLSVLMMTVLGTGSSSAGGGSGEGGGDDGDGDGDGDGTGGAEVIRIISEIDHFLEPYRQQSIEDKRGGRIFPLDLPNDPSKWTSDYTSPAETLPAKIRLLLRAGVCDQNSGALEKLFDLEWRLHGLNFNETEVLFLQRMSELEKLTLPFHSRYRQTKNYTANVSESPQQVMQVDSVFDKRRADLAMQLVPEFSQICANQGGGNRQAE
ncbi:MAG: hypothetical protein ABJH63_00640 [Rhizobiaceae bacterium]